VGWGRENHRPPRLSIVTRYKKATLPFKTRELHIVNFFVPNKKLVSKTTVGSRTIKKYDSPMSIVPSLSWRAHKAKVTFSK
jgi:hypothetical protein